MTSSAMELTERLAEDINYSELVLQEGAVKGLFANQRDDMKMNVALANQAWRTSGSAIRACAQCLNDIKENTPKGNWTALIKSGDLDFSASIATDLVSAHKWLSSSTIPDRFLANISARTLGNVSRIKDPKLKLKISEKIVETEGKGFAESDLKKMTAVGKSRSKKTGIAAKKGLPEEATKDDAVAYYTDIVNKLQDTVNLRDMRIKALSTKRDELSGQIAGLKERVKELGG